MIGTPFLRRFIRIKATDIPNIRRAIKQRDAGQVPDGRRILPGLMSWDEYLAHLATLSEDRKSVVLDATWWKGAEIRLVPDDWLDFAEEHAKKLVPFKLRRGRRWMGVDCGEGGDDSCWCVGDEKGVGDIVSLKTPDTNAVYGRTCMMVREYGVAWGDVIFDYGGGGKEHVDRLRASNFMVRGLRFGAIKKEIKRSMTFFHEKKEVEEDTASYVNRRSEMAYGLRMLLERPAVITDPLVLESMLKMGAKRMTEKEPFGLPMEMCKELRRQIACVPLDWDDQGRFKLIPKKAPVGQPLHKKNFQAKIGRSPDQFDAFCLMVWGMRNEPHRSEAGTQ